MKLLLLTLFVSLIVSCSPKNPSVSMKNYDTIPGTFAYDLAFLNKYTESTVVLADRAGAAKLVIIPGWQARVMTSTANGDSGFSYGWINYKLIESGEFTPHMNAFGGYERIWLGPEGGPVSIYFSPGKQQEFVNWFVPSDLDTTGFETVSSGTSEASFSKVLSLVNYSGTLMNAGIQRTIRLLGRSDVDRMIGMALPGRVRCVAYQSVNRLTNLGEAEWNKSNGMLSVWMLSMFNPSPGVTIFIPYKENATGTVVNDDYFGKVPENRLMAENGTIWFKADGKYRSKLGIPPHRAMNYAGSYDSENNVLTILWCDIPEGDNIYVNSKWGDQKDPFSGDVINAYNDGPVDDGSQMGPFYELESSSPAANLKKGESLIHTQRIFHFEGSPEQLTAITEKLFGLTIADIKTRFN